jgi:hypothetical protein
MTLRMDNKGAIDLVDKSSVGGRTIHINVRYFFLCEAKKKVVLVVHSLRI